MSSSYEELKLTGLKNAKDLQLKNIQQLSVVHLIYVQAEQFEIL